MPMNDVTRWGILGAGNIARRFCEGVQALPDARLVAVGSRDQAKADAFGEQFGIPHRHGSHQALVDDPEVDAIYVATTHNFHKEHGLLALNAGKPVLVEKPFTINAREAEELVAAARAKGLFLMEAMWSRYFPLTYRLRELLREGAIGRPWMVQADFGFQAGFNPSSRLFDPNLGGGALLDVGVYPVSFASMILGTPDRVVGLATLGHTGVDEVAGITLGHPGGEIAVVYTCVRTNTPQEAYILGGGGQIRIHAPWWRPDRMTVSRSGKADEEILMPFGSTGFNYEAAEVGRCLREGKLESDVLPLDESVAIMRTMDSLRAQWGLKYPME